MAPEKVRALGREGVRREVGGWTWKFDWRCLNLPIPPVWPQLPEIECHADDPRRGKRDHRPGGFRPRDARGRRRARRHDPGAHHHVPLDKPAELAAAVEEFAASLPA